MEQKYKSIWSRNFACNIHWATGSHSLRLQRKKLECQLDNFKTYLGETRQERRARREIGSIMKIIESLRAAERAAAKSRKMKFDYDGRTPLNANDFLKKVVKLRVRTENIIYGLRLMPRGGIQTALEDLLKTYREILKYNSKRRGQKTRDYQWKMGSHTRNQNESNDKPNMAERQDQPDFIIQISDEKDPSPVLNRNTSNTECTVCYEVMDLNEKVFFPCFHSFHRICSALWLREQRRCPICRTRVPVDFAVL